MRNPEQANSQIDSKMKVARGFREQDMGIYFVISIDFLSGITKEFWKWIVVIDAQHCECYKMSVFLEHPFKQRIDFIRCSFQTSCHFLR
jgi:hypothetical protein